VPLNQGGALSKPPSLHTAVWKPPLLDEKPLAPVFGLVVVYYQAGMNDAGDPAKKRQQKAEEETEDPAGH